MDVWKTLDEALGAAMGSDYCHRKRVNHNDNYGGTSMTEP